MLQLTEQQSRIVLHNDGPAVVFAVAGSGKTTTIVHRIERLVRERVFAARSILATSFSKAAVADGLRRRLNQWQHCDDVRTGTLHSLCLEILRTAQSRGHLLACRFSDEDPEGIEKTILNCAITQRRAASDSELARHNVDQIDREHFLDWLSCCKASLAFTPSDYSALPAIAQETAKLAEPPSNRQWYLELYETFERLRRTAGLITFDDMLVGAWEVAHRWPELLSELQARYECVLVDEYQDINKVQAEVLGLLTARHRNYMVIGDDDQTIYEWRGANPRYILEFQGKYGAHRFELTENFRSRAQQIVLANRVIQFNANRVRKSMQLTQGFDGLSAVRLHQNRTEMAKEIANEIKASVASGYKGSDIAILVRTYAQVSEIERSLIAEKVPFVVVGQDPFFLRTDLAVLIDYLRLGILERQLSDGQPLSNDQVAIFGKAWANVHNTPPRYLSHEIAASAEAAVAFHGASISRSLYLCSGKVSDAVSCNIRTLAEHIAWLASLARTSAGRVLTELRQKLNYDEFLRATSPNSVTADARMTAVYEFTAYANDKGTVTDFIQHIDSLKSREANEVDRVQILTIHRAKGAEWPIVIIPDCDADTFPPQRQMSGEKLEEERRLFYVALTRSKKQLHLHAVTRHPLSQFLMETNWAESLPIVNATREVLESGLIPPLLKKLSISRIATLLALDRYVELWWSGPAEHKRKLAEISTQSRKGEPSATDSCSGELEDDAGSSQPNGVSNGPLRGENAHGMEFRSRIAAAFRDALAALSEHELRVFFRERSRYENPHGEMDGLLRPHLTAALTEFDADHCQLEYVVQICIDYVWSLQTTYPDFWRFTQIPRDRPSDPPFRRHCDTLRATALQLHAEQYFETVNEPKHGRQPTSAGQSSSGLIERAGKKVMNLYFSINRAIHEYMQQESKEPVTSRGRLYKELIGIPWEEFESWDFAGRLRALAVFWKRTGGESNRRHYREDEIRWFEDMRPRVEEGGSAGAYYGKAVSALHALDLGEDKTVELISILLPKAPVQWRRACT